MAQVRIETIKKRLKFLNKINMDDVAFGNVINGQTQYHQDIEDIAHDLRVFARQLTVSEEKYIKSSEDRDALKAFFQLKNSVNGDTQKAISAMRQLSEKIESSQNNQSN